ncbi:MAG: protein kinase [Gemmatales bacterium]
MSTSVSSLQEFLDTLQASQLLSEKNLRKVTQSLSGQSIDPEKVGNLLVQKKLLTKYQVELLLRGKHQGFFVGSYKILQLISSNNSGKVYLAEHTALQRTVAIKVLPPSLAQDETKRIRFEKEGKAAAALDHPNIVKLFDINHDSTLLYLVMEHVDGVDLQKRIDKGLTLAVDIAANYALQAASALQHAHSKGIIHRDIKPSNLLVTKEGNIKILEMGLSTSRLDDDGTVSSTSNAHLNLQDYRAPEQQKHLAVDHRCDIYCLGATIYALLTGKVPPRAEEAQPLHVVKPSIPRQVSDLVSKMIAVNPDQRMSSMQDVITGFKSIEFKRRNSGAPHTAPVQRARPTAPVNPTVVAYSPPPDQVIAAPAPVVQVPQGPIEQPRNRASVSKPKRFKKSRKNSGNSRLLMGLVVGAILLATFAGVIYMVTRSSKGDVAKQDGQSRSTGSLKSIEDIKYVRFLDSSGQALTVSIGDSPAAGKLLMQKDEDLPTQRWEVVPSGIYVRLRNTKTGLYLTVNAGMEGADAMLASEKTGQTFTDQLWEVPWKESKWSIVSQNGKMAIVLDKGKGLVQRKANESELEQFWKTQLVRKSD